MFALRRMTEADREAVLGLAVSGDQLVFVDPIAETLTHPAGPREDHVIADGERIVGFFQIDCQPSGQTLPGHLELHEVSIGPQHQGKGYGKAFMIALSPYLLETYPGWPSVCLTVKLQESPGL